MGNILVDIINNINIKPNKFKLVIGWVVSVATSLIILAFMFGGFKSSYYNKVNEIDGKIDNNRIEISNIKKEMDNRSNIIDRKFEKVYDDGLLYFNDLKNYDDKQHKLIIEYGNNDNNDILKEMLEMNKSEITKDLYFQIDKSKNKTFKLGGKCEYFRLIAIINLESNDTTFHLIGAKKDFIDNIDRNEYDVGVPEKNSTYSELYNVTYVNK